MKGERAYDERYETSLEYVFLLEKENYHGLCRTKMKQELFFNQGLRYHSNLIKEDKTVQVSIRNMSEEMLIYVRLREQEDF
jgi:hypothetical protein